MGYVLNLRASIVRVGEDQVEAIWEGIRLDNHIAKQGSKVVLQAKEEMEKVKARALT